MPKSILVGFDARSGDRAPVQFGAEASRFLGAPLVVAAVYADAGTVSELGYLQVDEDLDQEVETALGQVRAELEQAGVQADCRALPDISVPAALHRAAEELDAGMLVVGSTHRGRVGRVLPGSTAERLMHGASCPVAVVPRSWQPGGGVHVVGVAFADTPEGREALDSGVALAARAGARVRVLSAVAPHHFGRAAGGRPGAERTTFDRAGLDAARVAEEALAEAARETPEVAVETDISAQDAAEFLIAASANVDVIVCGSRGYGPRRAVLLGGVSRKLVAAAQCPVIVLARGAETGLRAMLAAAADVAS